MMVDQNQKTTLLVDIGNSSLKWELSNSNTLSDMLQHEYPKDISSKFFESCWQDLEKPDEIIASCVADESVWQALEKSCKSLWNVKVQKVVSSKEGFGLINVYDDFLSLGSDRWCAMIGALHSTDSSFILIDAGSALTIDVVKQSGEQPGEHLGGYIVPGIGMMKNSLGLNTAQIMLGKKAKLPSLSLGKSTIDCVEAGIHLSSLKLIEAVFEEESKKLKKCQIFITGGDAKLLASLLSLKCVIIPDLVLRGLSIIAANDFNNNKGNKQFL